MREQPCEAGALEAVAALAARIAEPQDVRALARAILETALELTHAEAGSVLVADPEARELVFEHVVGPKATELLGARIPDDAGLAGRVFQSGEEAHTRDASIEPEHLSELAERIDYPAREMATLPLCLPGGERVGVLQVLNASPTPLAESCLKVLRIVAMMAASVIQATQARKTRETRDLARSLAEAHQNVQYLADPLLRAAESLDQTVTAHVAVLDGLAREAASRDETLASQLSVSAEDFGERAQRHLGRVKRGAARIRQRCRQIDWCISGRWRRPDLTETDVGEIAREVAEVLSPMARAGGVTLEVHEQATVYAQADGPQLFNALYNLVHDAVHHTDAEGRAWVRVSRLATAEYEIEVGHTGAGIPLSLPESDAEPLDAPAHGLKASMVAGTIAAHYGKLDASTSEAQEASVRMVLPINPSPRD
ncbi:MAG: GAF domain-containing protein [Armatimonadia bacterium]|nr:GAF domain-containing protein [Armatimonadia bacterium]